MRWNLEAAAEGVRRRVFCASMADIFEARTDLDLWRKRLWALIRSTPALDWLLLTKRPEQIENNVPWGKVWPKNVWIGTTAENQRWADRRIPVLLKHQAVVRFVSCEPLVGPLSIRRWLGNFESRPGIDWVIVGGESGGKARPMSPEWARDLRDECRRAGVAFHFKQWGQWRPENLYSPKGIRRAHIFDSRGRSIPLVRLGKHRSGRDLDGRTWDEFPKLHLAGRTTPVIDAHDNGHAQER